MRRSISAVGPVLLLLLSASPLEAQWRTPSSSSFEYLQVGPVPVVPPVQKPVTVIVARPRPVGYSIAGGLGGAVIGIIGGAYLGYKIDLANPCPLGCEDPGLAGLLAGAALGPALLVPIGTHLASGRFDALPRSLPATTAIGVLSYLGAWETNGMSVLLAPVLEIVAAIAIEKATEQW